MAGKGAGDESDVPAFSRKIARHAWRYLAFGRQRLAGHERIVAGIQHEGGNAYTAEPRLAARAHPVIVRVPEAVQRRRHDVVERAQRACASDSPGVVKAWMTLELRERFAFEGLQERGGIHQIET